jgi:hypothetical protein
LFLSGYGFKKIVPIIKNQAVNLQTIGIMKWQRLYCFLVVLLLILPAKIFSQQQMPRYAQNSPHRSMDFPFFREKLNIGVNSLAQKNPYQGYDFFMGAGAINKKSLPGLQCKNPGIIGIVEPGFFVSHLPFFCKKELQIEKATYLPLRLRLGSLEYVNKMEGKQ